MAAMTIAKELELRLIEYSNGPHDEQKEHGLMMALVCDYRISLFGLSDMVSR